LITGAPSGIGSAIANAMSRAGADQILLLARNEEKLNSVAKDIKANACKADIYAVDLSHPAAI